MTSVKFIQNTTTIITSVHLIRLFQLYLICVYIDIPFQGQVDAPNPFLSVPPFPKKLLKTITHLLSNPMVQLYSHFRWSL